MRVLAVLVALLLFLPAARLSAGDITGRWRGSIEIDDSGSGSTINTPVKAEFAQKANAISGKISRATDDDAEDIRNGKIDGNRVLFEVVSEETYGTIKFDLTMQGDRLEGMMKGVADTGPITGKVHLTREAAK